MERRGQQMDHSTLRRYNHRRDILEMQLGILEQNRSEGVRRRAHMMCRGMTDLSPDSGSSGGPYVEEEEEPESESISTQYYVGEAAASSGHAGTTMDEQVREDLDAADWYFSGTNVPGRNLPVDTTEQNQNGGEANDSDEEEIENSETESHRRLRYIYSGIKEVSDPEYWQELHHFSSDDEDIDSNDGNNNCCTMECAIRVFCLDVL